MVTNALILMNAKSTMVVAVQAPLFSVSILGYGLIIINNFIFILSAQCFESGC